MGTCTVMVHHYQPLKKWQKISRQRTTAHQNLPKSCLTVVGHCVKTVMLTLSDYHFVD